MFADGVSVNTYETTIITGSIIAIPIRAAGLITLWYMICSWSRAATNQCES
jgi:hypothetical protein